MFCSGCGNALAVGQPVCSQCGRPVAPAVPPVPGFQFQLENYAGKIRALSVVWVIYAGYSVLKAVIGMTFLHAFLDNHFGNWNHGPWADGSMGSMPPNWLGHAIFGAVWVSVLIRVGLALVAAWGLHERSQWGRIVAIVAAVLNLLHPLLGTALGIWTLVMLLGYQNSTLYQQLTWNPQTGANR